MLIDGLDHVQIAAPSGCEESARRFFGELLGMAEVEKPETLRGRGGVWFRAGDQQLHVGVEEPFTPRAQGASRAPRRTARTQRAGRPAARGRRDGCLG